VLDTELTALLDDLTRQVGETTDVDSVLEAIAAAARNSLDEVDHAGISIVHRDGTIETRAWTRDLVIDLDKLQYDLGEGPCLDAMHAEANVVHVDNVRHDQRWPTFIPQAVNLGLRSQLGVRVYVSDKTVGGLNLYSTSADAISEDSAALAHLFATQAAVALGRVRKVEDLMTALETRTTIGQAIGVLMERYKLDEDRAFNFLTRISQTNNVKLRDIAKSVIETVSRS
jgi:GAF domain-containing protein